MSEGSSIIPARHRYRLELVMVMATVILSGWLHLSNLRHAGGLWRDEAGSIGLATLPTLTEVWQLQARDSFPILFPLVIRTWNTVAGTDDLRWRCLGLIVGAGILVAVWQHRRSLVGGVPLIAFALLAVNPTIVRWGDALRAYGLGSGLMILTLTQLWRLTTRPSRMQFVLTALAAIASVQCLYQNCFLLLAGCAGAAAVAIGRRNWRSLGTILLVGLVAAVSLLPCSGLVRESGDWWMLEQRGMTLERLGQTLSAAVGDPLPGFVWFWSGALVLAIGTGIRFLASPSKTASPESIDACRFSLTALPAAILCYLAFVWLAKLPTQPWYWLPLLIFGAVCIDVILTTVDERFQSIRVVIAGAVVLWSCFQTAPTVQCRQTNVDLVASHLEATVAADDLVIVHPWYLGVSFSRYYHGRAPWSTLPPLTDHRFHRYDLLKAQLARANPGAELFNRTRQTLAGGRRVWLVGYLPFLPPGESAPPDLPPAPDSELGWNENAYSTIWGLQLTDLVQRHAADFSTVKLADTGCVGGFEDVAVYVGTGAKSSASSATNGQ